MGLKKPGSTAVEEAPVAAAATPQSGTPAAVGRLTTPKADTNKSQAAYKPRDFDAEARGKTRCVQFEAALMSPAIAGLKFKNIDEYLLLVKQAADAGVKYTFQD